MTKDQHQAITAAIDQLKQDPRNWRTKDLPCDFCGQWHGETYQVFDPFWRQMWERQSNIVNDRGLRIPFY